MVKKAFAIASIAALTGMVVAIAAAGCASNDGVTPVEDGGSEPDVRTPPPNPDGDDDDDDDGGDGKCYDEKPLDVSAEKYQPPRTKPGACKENVLEVIDDLIASKQSATFDELKAAIVAKESTVCAECVFGEDGDTWAPIVEKDGQVIVLNGGGCVELVSEKADCGKAYFHWDLCLSKACSKCTGSEAKSCAQDAQLTACKGASEALVAACGGTEAEVNKHLGACFKAGEVSVKGPIREQCIKGVDKDASTD
ncbi:MAG: hypothetical protein BGO98_24695 [Myxococcales bacterium 68-20]|nr:MAG: hypothetical protein BGO98_24695 [Myxococcales bacterium 68-20]